MSESKESRNQLLDQLHDLSKSVSKLLEEEDFDAAIEKLIMREATLERLIKKSDLSDFASKRQKIESIIKLDKKNQERLTQMIDVLFGELSNLDKEKRSVKNLQAISGMSKKPIVNLLY